MKFNVLILILVFFVIIRADDEPKQEEEEETIEISNEYIPSYSTLRFTNGNHTINRPLFHFTPKFGWMNDPNGCWKDNVTNRYHIYYQYNPNDTVWGMPLYWGHASSEDLLNWDHHEIAIRAPDWAGAYSGSMFIDDECFFSKNFNNCDTTTTSSFKPIQNTIAAWTWNRKNWSEAQCLSFSENGGYKFETPKDYCPEVDEFDDQFRDPQIVKVTNKTYVMSIAKSHQYSIHFYSHENENELTDNKVPHFNKFIGKFSLQGYLGYQYECPNLVHLNNTEGNKNNDTTQSYWVLFISINPGSQQGGSSTQYFIGQFKYPGDDPTKVWTEKDEPFELAHHYTTLIDVGKDFYAMQLVYVPPSAAQLNSGFNESVGITWASNWQYTALVPTDPWRSSMAIPRTIKLGYYSPTGTPLVYIKSRMMIDYDLFENKTLKELNIQNSGDTMELTQNANGALDFFLTFRTCGDAFTNHFPGVISLYLIGGSIPEEYLIVGYNVKADAFFLDRGHTNVQWVHQNPFFTDKLSMNVYGTKDESTGKWTNLYKQYFRFTKDNTGDQHTYTYKDDYNNTCTPVKFKVHGLIDRNIIELFFNEDEEGYSFITSTNTFFFTGGNFIDKIRVEYNLLEEKGFDQILLQARQLNLKKKPETSTRRITEKETDL